jgi:type IV pilus assembly protein PilB
MRRGELDEATLAEALATMHGVPAIKLSELEPDPALLALFSYDIALRHLAIPVNRMASTLVVAMADPSNLTAIDTLKFITGYKLEVVVAPEAAIRDAIDRYYATKESENELGAIVDAVDVDSIEVEHEEPVEALDISKSGDDAPIVKLVHGILLDAIRRGASDIHLEPQDDRLRVRYRIDGMLHDIASPRGQHKAQIAARVKVMAKLDISERRLPQDGRIRIIQGGRREMDFRVSVLPSMFGEKIVLRLLDKSALALDMSKLGFEPKPLADFKAAIAKPYGMCLVTGPTGSGKTTTLYSALSELNRSHVNITTVEDPIEYQLRGITQVQVKDEIGLTFAECLRTFSGKIRT